MSEDLHRRVEELFHAVRMAPASDRARLLDEACGGDLELRSEVESLLRIEADAPSYLDRPLAAPGIHTESADAFEIGLPCQIGDYRLVREVGRGGMGRVYEAVQEGVGRQVAIKLLPPTLSSVAFRRRFRSEQRILAGLEHPGIARLYDAGTPVDGMPYLVMEFIQGQSLLAYSKSRRLGLPDRLRLFARVCDAVQFAHQHLVVHRDLKPSNILVTDAGEPKLLDFGIAKLLHADDETPAIEATLTGQRLMTPEYASPEQIRGEPVTTASDVYSLGVVLYELLTERKPYRLATRSPHELERSVLEQTPERPSSAVRHADAIQASDASAPDLPRTFANALRGDVDNIVLKALAKRPAERYVTADELGDDVRRHVEGLPVRARPDRLSYRAGKFVRRHRWAVASGLGVAAALVAALAMTMASAADARRERDLAARRFGEVRQLANVFLFDVEQKIRDIPGTTAARELLVNTSLGYLDRLAADAGNDPTLLRELAGGYDRLGDVQGALLQANLGQSDAALSSYLKASALRARLATGDRLADTAALREGARGELKLSTAMMRVARLKDAAVHSKLALDLLTRIAPSAQDQDIVLRERAEALVTHGYMTAVNGDLDGGLGFYRQAKSLYETLPRARFDEPVFGAGYALAVFRIAQALAELPEGKGRAEAIALLPEAIAIDRRLFAADAHSAGLRRSLARDLAKLADLLGDSGRCDEAVGYYESTLQLAREEMALDPRDQLARRNHNSVTGRVGRCLITLDRADEARARLEPAMADIASLLSQDPKNITVQISFCEIAVRFAEAAARLGDRRPELLTAAKPSLLRAIEMLEPLVANKTLIGGDAAVLDQARAAMGQLAKGLGTRD